MEIRLPKGDGGTETSVMLEPLPDSPHFPVHAPPIAMPLPACSEKKAAAGRRRLRLVARCVVLGPLVAGGALLVGCFLMCPMLWLRMPAGERILSRVLLLGAAGVSLWAAAAGAAFCYWRQRRCRRPPAPSLSLPTPPNCPPPWAHPRPRSRSFGATPPLLGV